MDTSTLRKLPAEPLLRVIALRGGLDFVLRKYPRGYAPKGDSGMPSHPDAKRIADVVKRCETRGWFNDEWVDYFCVKVLGVMPHEVYGELWWDD